VKSNDRIPDGVLKETFSEKLKRSHASKTVNHQLKYMILSGKLKKGNRIIREHIAQYFNVNKAMIDRAFAKLKKDGLVIIKGSGGSFVKGNE
jgi:DNA-binding GntR family transcriptional regulator